jgi:hypothetical protein
MSITAAEIREFGRVRGQRGVVTDMHELHSRADDGQALVDLLWVAVGGHGLALRWTQKSSPEERGSQGSESRR